MLFKTLHEKHVQLKKGGIQNFPVLNILSSKLFIGFYLKKTEKKEEQEIVWHLELLLELQTFWTYEFIISLKIIWFPGLKQIQT